MATHSSRPSTPPPPMPPSPLPHPHDRRLPFYSESEVATHNVSSDCWVSYFGRVYDLTPLIQSHSSSDSSTSSSSSSLLLQPLIQFAGSDITHWFDSRTQQPKTHISPHTGLREAYTPYGRYLHIPPSDPCSNWDNSFSLPWWCDRARYQVGYLSKRQRKIKIVNMLTGQETILSVCAEERMSEIRHRYIAYNSHALNYTLKRLGRMLHMERTLEENDIPDESEEFNELGIEEEKYIPALHAYYDDLTAE